MGFMVDRLLSEFSYESNIQHVQYGEQYTSSHTPLLLLTHAPNPPGNNAHSPLAEILRYLNGQRLVSLIAPAKFWSVYQVQGGNRRF